MKLEKYRRKTKNIGQKVDLTAAIIKLQERINEVIEEFIEVFEVELFELTRVHAIELRGKTISFSSFGLVHHVYSLKYGEYTSLNESDRGMVDSNLETILNINEQAVKEYHFMLQCIQFASAMLIK